MQELNAGNTIQFGKYRWQILVKKEDRILIITEDIIDQCPYHNRYVDITWEDCSIRSYLNDEFYHTFNQEERENIIAVVNENSDNQWYGTKGGSNTSDHIFLLSLHEVCSYFGDSTDKLYHPGKNQRYWFERKDENNPNRLAKLIGTDYCWWWWLRSPGRVGIKAAYIWGTDGTIGIQGNNILKGNVSDGKCTGGIRPALWLKTDTK